MISPLSQQTKLKTKVLATNGPYYDKAETGHLNMSHEAKKAVVRIRI